MSSVREQIFLALEALIASIPDYGSDRNPMEEPTPEQMPILLLEDGGEPDPDYVTGADKYQTEFSVSIHVKPALPERIEETLDKAYVAVMQKLRSDTRLGGLAIDVERLGMSDPIYERAAGHIQSASVVVDFIATYWTKGGDVSVVDL